MELALVKAMMDGAINMMEITNAYTRALEAERYKSKMRFEEACTCLSQYLLGHYPKKNPNDMHNRMIHIFNRSETLPHDIYNKQYGYTEEDKKKWDEHCRMIYGTDL